MDPRAEHRFARQVPVARVLDHRAGGDFPDLAFSEIEFIDKCSHGRREHGLVAGLHVGAVRARERDASAAEDGHPAQRACHRKTLSLFVRN